MSTNTVANRRRNAPLSSTAIACLITTVCLLPFHQARTQSEETFTLNLNNVDILSLIETVSNNTGKNFIVDPRVKAKVSVISSGSIDADKLYELFLSVLDVHGYAAVPAGSVIKILPLAVGVQNSVPVFGDHSGAGDELITEVIPVRNISAQLVVEALRPLVPAPVSLSAEASSNTVIITDRAANIARLIEIIDSLDK